MIILISLAWTLDCLGPHSWSGLAANSRPCPKLAVFPSPLTDHVGGGLLANVVDPHPEVHGAASPAARLHGSGKAKEGGGGGPC